MRFIMADNLKLCHAPSPNSRRARIFLAEKGTSVPLVAVDLAKSDRHVEAYRVINPRRVVPTLVLEHGTAIGEVLAIWALPRGDCAEPAAARALAPALPRRHAQTPLFRTKL
jgi:Glutathione S-transferase, N-terminal domain